MTTNTAPHATHLHQQAIVIDGHSDILVPIADQKARLADDFALPDPATWHPPPGMAHLDSPYFSAHTQYFGPAGQYSIPQFLAGGVTVQTCAIYMGDDHLDRALQRGLEMVWWLQKEAEENAEFEIVTSAAAIRQLKASGQCGAILSFEGFEPLGNDLRLLDIYYQLGLRMASLTHSRRNLFADGAQYGVMTGGLTLHGRDAIKRMNELGIVIDLAHISETGFWEILDLTQQPVVVSHATPYVFSQNYDETPRQPGFDLPDDSHRLKAIADNGGVVGVIWFSQADVGKVADDIETLLDVIGPDHVGIGSDLYGLQYAPQGLENIAKIPAITQCLVERGYSDDVILKILGGNFLRVFEQVWRS